MNNIRKNQVAMSYGEGALHKCSKCGRLLPIEQFAVRRSGYLTSWCKSCTHERIQVNHGRKRAEEVMKEMPPTAEEEPEKRHERINHVKDVTRAVIERARAKRIQRNAQTPPLT
jgi:ribosome-binding protein aMBF1 (putative translation factor)